MSKSESLTRQKGKQESSDLSRFDAAALVASTAVEVRDKGHQIVVRHAKVQGEQGILIFIPGFQLVDGNLSLVANEVQPAAELAD